MCAAPEVSVDTSGKRHCCVINTFDNVYIYRAQNNGLSQVIFRPTLVYDRASPIWEDIFYCTFPIGKPMIVCNNVPTLNE